MLCSTNRVPISYEITAANAADLRLTQELLAEADLTDEVARKLYGDLAYRSRALKEDLAGRGVLLVTERAAHRGIRQQIEIAFACLKKVFGLGQTLATTLTGIVIRLVTKVAAYTFGFYINRMLGRPQGRIKELWA